MHIYRDCSWSISTHLFISLPSLSLSLSFSVCCIFKLLKYCLASSLHRFNLFINTTILKANTTLYQSTLSTFCSVVRFSFFFFSVSTRKSVLVVCFSPHQNKSQCVLMLLGAFCSMFLFHIEYTKIIVAII